MFHNWCPNKNFEGEFEFNLENIFFVKDEELFKNRSLGRRYQLDDDNILSVSKLLPDEKIFLRAKVKESENAGDYPINVSWSLRSQYKLYNPNSF